MRNENYLEARRITKEWTSKLTLGAAAFVLTAWSAYAEPGTSNVGKGFDDASAGSAKAVKGDITKAAKGIYYREFDPKIAAASRKRVSEKVVGALRGTLEENEIDIFHDAEEPEVKQQAQPKPQRLRRKPVTMQRRAWQKRKGEKALPPMVDAMRNGEIDTIITGSSQNSPGVEMENRGYQDRAKKLNPYPVQ